MPPKSRPSPSESSTQFSLGVQKKGNDGNTWIVVSNKNGVHRWKKIDKSDNKSAKVLYDNKEQFIDMLKSYELSKAEHDKITLKSDVWAEYLKPAAKQLMDEGILLFIYPMGYYWTDNTEEDLEDYVQNNKSIISFFEKYYNIKINTKSEYFYDELDKLPIMYYLATTSDDIYIKHNLPKKEMQNYVKDIFKKIYSTDYKWDGKSYKAIHIHMKGTKKTYDKSFVQILAEKLRKDVNANFKIIKRGVTGDPNSEKAELKNISIIKFDTDERTLKNLLLKYGLREQKSSKKHKSSQGDERIVDEDDFYIDPVKKELYVNFSEGMNGRVYNNLFQ